MSKITNLINKEEDILSSIDENKYLEKEVEIPTGGLKYSKLNADALGNAVALWMQER